MPDYDRGASQPANKPMTRIENQTEVVKNCTARIEGLIRTNVEHAHQLGFFEPPKEGARLDQPSPVITSLDDAIRELQRAVEALDGSMSLFN